MKHFVKFALSSIALLSLAACGASAVTFDAFHQAAVEASKKTSEYVNAEVSYSYIAKKDGEDKELLENDFKAKLVNKVWTIFEIEIEKQSDESEAEYEARKVEETAALQARLTYFTTMDAINESNSPEKKGLTVKFYTSSELKLVVDVDLEEDSVKEIGHLEKSWNECGMLKYYLADAKATQNGVTQAARELIKISYSK